MTEIRRATKQDIESVVILGEDMHAESDYAGLNYDYDMFRDFITIVAGDPSRYYFLVAERDGEIVGFFVGLRANFYFSPDEYTAEVLMYVTPDYRGGSTALRFVRAFEDWSDDLGVARQYMSVSTNSEQADTFYSKLGYAKVGTVRKRNVEGN